MADPGSPRGSETSAIDLTFALEAAGETQPQRAVDKASGEWLPFTAAGSNATWAKFGMRVILLSQVLRDQSGDAQLTYYGPDADG